jgi:hypothetical protein
MAENTEKNNQKNKVSTIEKRKIVLAMANSFKEKFEADRPTPKLDLNYTEVHTLLMDNEKAKPIFTDLFLNQKIRPSDSLSQWKAEHIQLFKNIFTFNKEEDVEDKRLLIAESYEVWYRKNNPTCKKRITPSTITVSKIFDMLGATKENMETLPNLYKYGVVSLSWKLSHLKIEALDHLQKSLK